MCWVSSWHGRNASKYHYQGTTIVNKDSGPLLCLLRTHRRPLCCQPLDKNKSLNVKYWRWMRTCGGYFTIHNIRSVSPFLSRRSWNSNVYISTQYKNIGVFMQIFYCFKTTLLCSDHCDWVDVKDLSFTNFEDWNVSAWIYEHLSSCWKLEHVEYFPG